MEYQSNSIKAVNRKILLCNLLTTPAAVAVVLGTFGLLGKAGDGWWVVLNQQNVALSLMIIGGVLEISAFLMLLPLLRQRNQLEKHLSN